MCRFEFGPYLCSLAPVPQLYRWKVGGGKGGLLFPLYLLSRFRFAHSSDNNLLPQIFAPFSFCSLPRFQFVFVYTAGRRPSWQLRYVRMEREVGEVGLCLSLQ